MNIGELVFVTIIIFMLKFDNLFLHIDAKENFNINQNPTMAFSDKRDAITQFLHIRNRVIETRTYF